MTEQVQVASLQEELKTTRNYAKRLGVLSLCAAMLMIVGFSLTFFFPEFAGRIGAPILGILGAIIFPLGAVAEWKANKTKVTLTRKLEEMSIKVSACPNCKKEVLQGVFEVCPFCGRRLR